MIVNEIFESIQGEGRYAGTPALFIRLSGCNRNCPWCDTKYHNEGKEMAIHEVVNKIYDSGKKIVVWTGGEPCLQKEHISLVLDNVVDLKHHIETNGTIKDADFLNRFDYVCVSPKSLSDYSKFHTIHQKMNTEYDIKVVTNLEGEGKDILLYATMLMPLSTYDVKKDLEIQKKVWNYCVKRNKKYSPRLHVDVWGTKRGI